MKALITLTLISLIGLSFITTKPNKAVTQEHLNDKEIIKGTIIQKKSYNKAGNVLPGLGDYYLQINQEKYFIKISESTIDSDKLKTLLGEKITFEVVFLEGLWDTDDPSVQSRIGKYVTILGVLDE